MALPFTVIIHGFEGRGKSNMAMNFVHKLQDDLKRIIIIGDET
jgi:predicted alpha/beta-fold hydrolase